MAQAHRPLSIAVIDADISSRSAVARLLLAHGHPSHAFASMNAYDAHHAATEAPKSCPTTPACQASAGAS